MNKQVPLILAKKLQEAFPDWKTEKYWQRSYYTAMEDWTEWEISKYKSGLKHERVIAPDTDELLEKLPPKIPVIDFDNWLHLHTLGKKIGWCAHYSDAEEYKGVADTPAEALGELLLQLRREKIV